MTGYASLLDNQQVQNITKKAQLHDAGVENMDMEVCNLKKQLSLLRREKGFTNSCTSRIVSYIKGHYKKNRMTQRF
ncbi:hypothetical protein AgCh_021250 [Apium graveolens]